MGIPQLTLWAVVSLAVYITFFVSLCTADALGANSSAGIRATVIIAIVRVLVYPLSKSFNRRRGVDLGLAFKELPPE